MPVAPLVIVPLANDTVLLSVKVFVPTPSAPLVSVSAPPTVTVLPRLTPLTLLIVRPLNVVALEPPIVWAPAPGVKAKVLVP